MMCVLGFLARPACLSGGLYVWLMFFVFNFVFNFFWSTYVRSNLRNYWNDLHKIFWVGRSMKGLNNMCIYFAVA